MLQRATPVIGSSETAAHTGVADPATKKETVPAVGDGKTLATKATGVPTGTGFAAVDTLIVVPVSTSCFMSAELGANARLLEYVAWIMCVPRSMAVTVHFATPSGPMSCSAQPE